MYEEGENGARDCEGERRASSEKVESAAARGGKRLRRTSEMVGRGSLSSNGSLSKALGCPIGRE